MYIVQFQPKKFGHIRPVKRSLFSGHSLVSPVGIRPLISLTRLSVPLLLAPLYALIDPRDRLPFYVGQTNNKDRRLEEHCNPEERDKSPRAKRIRELAATGALPEIVVLERCERKLEALRKETYWIEQLRGRGHALTNRDGLAFKRMAQEVAKEKYGKK